MARGFSRFDTAIGRCGIAWDNTHVLAIRFPARDDVATGASLLKYGDVADPADVPHFVTLAIAAIVAHLAGDHADLDALPVDLARVGTFDRAVLEACRRIPSGSTRTYGEIAREIGAPEAARAVGAALGRNPWPIVVPCHRVVAANGKLGGFSAPGGRASKVRLLDIEGAMSRREPTLFDAPDQVRKVRPVNA